jgi:hypothetical protein
MAFSSRILVATLALGLSVAASTVMARASADAAPAPASSSMGHMDQGMMQGNMHDKMHDKMHRMGNGSMHKMPATVTLVDTSTGKVEVNSGGMALTVHFPPKSIADLKVGDKITLHMGYSK